VIWLKATSSWGNFEGRGNPCRDTSAAAYGQLATDTCTEETLREELVDQQ